MKKLIPFFFLLFAVISYAQDEGLDKMELRNGQVIMGKVEKIKTDVVEFKESETGLIYESAKKDITYILLANGTVLTYAEEYQAAQQNETQTPQQQPVVVEQDSGPSVALIILATVGVVLIVLLIISAAAY